MSIKIKTEKKIIRGEKFYKIVGVKALQKEELPKKYTELLGSVCLKIYKNDDEWLWVRDSTGLSMLVRKGDLVPSEKMEKITDTCKKAGVLLRKINLELKVENEGWEGEETFVI